MAELANTLEISLRLARGAFQLHADLRLPVQGTTVVFGPSGCGKSTLLRAIAGLEPAASGGVQIAGELWQAPQFRLPAHRRAVGMVFQHSALLPHLSVQGNLRYGWKRAGASAALLAQWIERLQLTPLLARRPHSLSGGERQRVALARALVTAPKVLLLDEPLSALDAQRRSEILPFLETVRRDAGIPILYVTHAVEEVARLADYLVLMEAGHITSAGPALELLNRNDLPLALRDDAGVVLDAQVIDRDAHGLLALHTRAGTLYAHGPAHPPGTPLRIRIQARDVSLALHHHDDSSLLNLLPATLETLDALPGGQVQVRLLANGTPLLARISHRSLERLQLQPGMALWVQIKAVALLV
ncbi:molybdenum ABC transporter ATP-binding protein [Thermomonas sp.]|uniref:molybdenum ABC transporter ATP-binding protein n=1 Tax=Thermomonas sp. TaxID=1971895 RepID=UPI002591EEF3|nr:molybdenum ABC transporter ATP-binding protein [Thermomonas sp.]HOC10475.1 molybdenum ABC transporter ATP-binding protein [Thermomonas sp.]HQA02863.1 molybdenum ABC transporter ATP-binding protein [Thermomonas sp.]HQE06907.1 molybdenum ABC transporter ATP-binding protein [Thermomonas sp.]